MPNFKSARRPMSRETLTVSNAVKVLTSTVYQTTPVALNQNGKAGVKAHGATITVDTSGFGVRFTRDGTTPAAGATGEVAVNTGTLPLPAGSLTEIQLDSFGAICSFKMIREGGSDAVVQVEYYA